MHKTEVVTAQKLFMNIHVDAHTHTHTHTHSLSLSHTNTPTHTYTHTQSHTHHHHHYHHQDLLQPTIFTQHASRSASAYAHYTSGFTLSTTSPKCHTSGILSTCKSHFTHQSSKFASTDKTPITIHQRLASANKSHSPVIKACFN